jgi:lysozyme family protein
MLGRSDRFTRWATALIDVSEGGFVNDPDDPGLATNWGISLAFAFAVGDSDRDGRLDLDVDGDGDVDIDDIQRLTRDSAVSLYHDHFWASLRCDELPGPLAIAVADAGVNQGRGPAVSMLQGVLGVRVDGRLGPRTLAAAQAIYDDVALAHYMAARAQRYVTTANYLKYGKGWFRRLFNVHRVALTEA